jgi:hypothetical protein
VNREIHELIRQMSVANPLWGVPRIHGEMLNLGIEVSQATVGRHRSGGMVRPHQPGGPSCAIKWTASPPSTCLWSSPPRFGCST